MNSVHTIYFAGGCFWGTEHYFRQIRGVVATRVGYANSSVAEPTYRQVCSGTTGAAEAVEVAYDSELVSLPFLIDLYFETIDPTSVNRQGNDVGTQYRTGIYYTDMADRADIEAAIGALADRIGEPVAVEMLPLVNFYPAEDYHQRYLDKNPGGYCHISKRLFDMARRAEDPSRTKWPVPPDGELRSRLTPLQYEVARHAATEPPFANEYYDDHRRGIYVDIVTGEPLFVSSDKFDSGCGWPSFSRPIDPSAIVTRRDLSHGMDRTEVLSSSGRSHLGHVFPDGPTALGGLRYCINSASLRFIPLDEMPGTPYVPYIPLVR